MGSSDLTDPRSFSMKTRGQKTPAAGLVGHDDGCATPKGAFVFTCSLLRHSSIIPAHSRIMRDRSCS